MAADSEELLEIKDLRVRFGDLPVLEGVSLKARRGEVLAIVGESGSGKSVLARSVLGLAGRGAKASGSVRFSGRELLGLGDKALSRVRGREISLMVQDAQSALNPVYRIGSQLMETVALKSPAREKGRGAGSRFSRLFLGGRREKDVRREAAELLEEAGLGMECFQAFPHQLSGGMRQRAMLALAMAGRPRLLIADEPTTALDVVIQKQILGGLVESARRRGASVILISHDLHLVGEWADSLVVLYAGRVMESGPAGGILAAPANPYTRDLLAATPRAGTPKGSLRPIPGEAPPPGLRPAGCPFLGRCREGEGSCAKLGGYAEAGPGWLTLCRAMANGRALRGERGSANSPVEAPESPAEGALGAGGVKAALGRSSPVFSA
jgi:oligopeptide/dipeptide ABC transporter ATP-binding protein